MIRNISLILAALVVSGLMLIEDRRVTGAIEPSMINQAEAGLASMTSVLTVSNRWGEDRIEFLYITAQQAGANESLIIDAVLLKVVIYDRNNKIKKIVDAHDRQQSVWLARFFKILAQKNSRKQLSIA